MDKTRMASMYREYLDSEGFRPKIDEDGDVTFKSEGGSYVIIIDGEDPSFFRLVFPNFWEFTGDTERARIQAACDAANRNSKVAKVFTVEDNVWGSIELFFGKPEEFELVFERALAALKYGVRVFVEQVQAESSEVTHGRRRQ